MEGVDREGNKGKGCLQRRRCTVRVSDCHSSQDRLFSDVPHGLLDVLQQRGVLPLEHRVQRLQRGVEHGQLGLLVVVAVHDRLVDLLRVGLQERQLQQLQRLVLGALHDAQAVQVVPRDGELQTVAAASQANYSLEDSLHPSNILRSAAAKSPNLMLMPFRLRTSSNWAGVQLRCVTGTSRRS